LVDINSTVAAGLMDAVKHALGQSMAKLKVEVKTK
jgi:hypothetical protein